MGKKRVLMVLILLALLAVIVFTLIRYNILQFDRLITTGSITGRAISEIPRIFDLRKLSTVSDIFTQLDYIKLSIAVGALILLIIIISIIFRHRKRKKQEKIKKTYNSVKKNGNRPGKSATSMDILYSMLKNKKSLKISQVAKTFNISKEKASEWAKILEDHDLATIEYPTFSEPILEYKKSSEEHAEKHI